MRRKTLLTVAVVGLMLLSGCSGFTGDSGDGGSNGDYPAADSLDQSVLDDHRAALEDTSFTTTTNLSAGGFSSVSTVKVDSEDDQYLQTSETAFGNATLYTSGDTSYQRSQQGNETRVTRSERDVNATTARSGGQTFQTFLSDNVTYEQTGTETVDGVEAMRYEAEGVDALSDEVRDTVGENVTLTNFSSTLLIGEDGVIREFHMVVGSERDGQATTTEYTVTVTDVGSTDVEEPSWVAEANETSAE